MLVTEMWMDRVARMTDQPLQSIRQLNLYKEKERTHFGQILHGSQIQVCPLSANHVHDVYSLFTRFFKSFKIVKLFVSDCNPILSTSVKHCRLWRIFNT